jgi:hypothetical protein
MENVGCLFVSMETFVDCVDTENALRTKSVFANPHFNRNVCQFHSNGLIFTSGSFVAGTYVNFIANRCLAVDYSRFQAPCHNIALYFVNFFNYL